MKLGGGAGRERQGFGVNLSLMFEGECVGRSGEVWAGAGCGSGGLSHTDTHGPTGRETWTQERRWVALGVRVGNSLSHNHPSEKLCGPGSQT